MFDFTKEVDLDQKNYRIYRRLQKFLYLVAVFLVFYFSYLILFPNQFFTFSFLNPDSTKNTILKPNTGSKEFPVHGKISEKNELFFNAVPTGDFSKAKINLDLSNDSQKIIQPILSARKSYQAFLYDEGNPIGFKDGSLLKNNGNYYLVSDGELRKFSDLKILSELGYSDKNFMEVANEELKYNPAGQLIENENLYPNAAIFNINDAYYILENQMLKKFVSEQAFLTQHVSSQAIEKDKNFLENYSVSDDLVGFADGTLIAYGNSVFIISGEKILPIDETITFESKGYDWADLINASGDEIALYKKSKLFQISNIHPDGTVFKTLENSRYYIIENNQKHLLPSENIAKSWTKKNPVLVSEKGLEISAKCNLKKSVLFNFYSCEMPLDNFVNLLGPEYEFRLASGNNIKIDSINVDFAKNINSKNFQASLGIMLKRFKINYGMEQ